MELSKVYKYRGIEEFDRDLEAIVQNYFFAPNSFMLNDPCETIITTSNLQIQLEMFESVYKGFDTKSTKILIEDFIKTKN